MTSKAWPYEEARKLLKRWPDGKPDGEPMLFETGYGPSGLPHIGTFNEVLRTTMVRHAYEELTGGAPTRLIAFSDDMDGLRKVPDNVPNAGDAGRASRQAADPDPRPVRRTTKASRTTIMRCCAHFLDRFGFDYEFVSSTECYASGRFDEALRQVLRKWDGDPGRDAADPARGAAPDLFAGPADLADQRPGAAGAGRGGRCRSRHDRLHRRGRHASRAVGARRHGQAAVEGRLGDALGRARRRL